MSFCVERSVFTDFQALLLLKARKKHEELLLKARKKHEEMFLRLSVGDTSKVTEYLIDTTRCHLLSTYGVSSYLGFMFLYIHTK